MADAVMEGTPAAAAPVEQSPGDWARSVVQQMLVPNSSMPPPVAAPAQEPSPQNTPPVETPPAQDLEPSEPPDGTGPVTPETDDEQEPTDPRAKRSFERFRKENRDLRRQKDLYESRIAQLEAQISAKRPPEATASRPESKYDHSKPPEIPDVGKFSEDPDGYNNAWKEFHAHSADHQKWLQSRERITADNDALFQRAKDVAGESVTEEAFNGTPISFPLLSALARSKDGPKVLAYLAAHPEEAAQLAEDTDAGGTTYLDALDEADRNPAMARAFGAAESIAKLRIKEIAAAMAKPTAPIPIRQTRAMPPGGRVSPAASAPLNPIEEAANSGDFARYAKLQAEQWIRNR